MAEQNTVIAPGRSVAANALSLFIGRLVAALSIWAAIIILAKMSGPEVVGVYVLAQAICIAIAEIAKLGLKEARSSDVAKDYSARHYMVLRLLMCAVALAAMVGAGATQADTSMVLIVIAVYGLTRVVEMITDIVHAQFLLVGRLDYVGWSLCISGPLSLVALALGYYFSGSLLVAVFGQLAAQFSVLVLYDLPIYRRMQIAGDEDAASNVIHKIASLARIALPLGFATALIMVGMYVPRIWVNAELGVVALGIFGPILAFCMAPDRLVNSLCLAMSVRLANHYAAGQLNMVFLRLGQVSAGLLILGVPMVYVCYLYGSEILTAIYSAEFAEHVDLFVILAAAGLIRIIANVLAFGLIASRQFWWMTLQNGAVAIAAILGCVFLIVPYGLIGAAWCMMMIFVAQLLFVIVALFFIPKPNGAPVE